MTVNIQFDTGYLSREEATGLSAFLGAVEPSLLTAAALREQQARLYGQYPAAQADLIGSTSLTPAYAPETSLPATAQAAKTETTTGDTPAKPTRTRKPKAEEVAAAADAKPALSTDPENRIDPQNPEDEAQDAADEAEETASEQEPAKPATVEDVKAAIGKYVAKFQLPATQEDGPGIFKSVLGAPPAGEPYWKLSILPADQAKLAACRDAWLAAAGKAERTKVA